MNRRTAIITLLLLAIGVGAIAAFVFSPKHYRLGEHMVQTNVFWNSEEAFLFLTTNTTGRATNIVQEKLASTRYGYLWLMLGDASSFYKQETIAYHLLSSGKLQRFPLHDHTAIYGSWTLSDGKLQLMPQPNSRDSQQVGFRWDGEQFVSVTPESKPAPNASNSADSKLSADDLTEDDGEDAGFLGKTQRKMFQDGGWHYKTLTGYESKSTEATLPVILGENTFNLTLRRFPPTRGVPRFDLLSYGTGSIELSGHKLEPRTVALWRQNGWKDVSRQEYYRLAQQYGHGTHQPFVTSAWLFTLAALLFWRFGSWIHVLFTLATMKGRVLKNMATSYSFPPVTPAQFPMLDTAALDRYTRELEAMGFSRLLDLSMVADSPNYPPNFIRLFVHSRHHCFGEVAQPFPRKKVPMPMKCSIQSCLQNGWTLGFSDRKPQAASSLLRRKKAMAICMPEATTTELLQAFLKMREQVCLDLGISPLNDDTLEAYIRKNQAAATDMRDAVQQKNFARGLSEVYYRKFSLLKTQPEYVWLGVYPTEAERRKQGYTMAAGAH
jgi:hypothetical protein